MCKSCRQARGGIRGGRVSPVLPKCCLRVSASGGGFCPPSYHRVISWDFCFRMPPTCGRIHLYEELRVCSLRTQGS